MKPLSLLETMQAFIAAQTTLTPGARVLVAVSGGLDSTVLTHLLHRAGYACGLAHCNYQLRYEDSDMDEMRVLDIAAELGLPYHFTDINLGACSEPGESTQMAARRLRYIYLKKTLDEYNYDALVTAHHLQDSLETVMINLLRGSGLAGLKGITPEHGRTVRPLLGIDRNQLLSYAQANGVTWREDKSNESDDYLRNRIRHHLTPVLEDLGLNYGTLANTLTRLRTEHHLLDYGYTWWKDRVVREEGERTIIQRDHLHERNHQLNLLLLARFSPFKDFTEEQYRQLLVRDGSGSLESPTGLAEITPSTIIFRPLPEAPDVTDLTITHLPFRVQRGAWHYLLEEVDRPKDLSQLTSLFFCLTALPLHLRSRKDGDRFQPLGMGGKSKKVKELLTERKLTAAEKANLLLLTTDEGRIMSVACLRGSEEFRVGAADKCVLQLTLTHKNPDQRQGRSGFGKRMKP